MMMVLIDFAGRSDGNDGYKVEGYGSRLSSVHSVFNIKHVLSELIDLKVDGDEDVDALVKIINGLTEGLLEYKLNRFPQEMREHLMKTMIEDEAVCSSITRFIDNKK